MYLRFKAKIYDKNYEEWALGVFQSSRVVLELKEIDELDFNELKNIRKWFDKNLEKPTRFSKSKNKNADEKSISWFKSEAKAHIEKMREMKVICEKYDVIFEEMTTKTPGYVIYEDEYQMSAIPFKNDLKTFE